MVGSQSRSNSAKLKEHWEEDSQQPSTSWNFLSCFLLAALSMIMLCFYVSDSVLKVDLKGFKLVVVWVIVFSKVCCWPSIVVFSTTACSALSLDCYALETLSWASTITFYIWFVIAFSIAACWHLAFSHMFTKAQSRTYVRTLNVNMLL